MEFPKVLRIDFHDLRGGFGQRAREGGGTDFLHELVVPVVDEDAVLGGGTDAVELEFREAWEQGGVDGVVVGVPGRPTPSPTTARGGCRIVLWRRVGGRVVVVVKSVGQNGYRK